MKGHVLVIDEEAEVRRYLSVGLKQEGCAVTTCADGLSAIHELSRAAERGDAFDYLVSGIFLPDINGLKILKVIKALHPSLPVLIVTGFGDEALKRAALSERNTAYLDKPLRIADVVRALGSLSPATTRTDYGPACPVAETPPPPEPARAYLAVRIARRERSMAIFNELSALKGVRSCDAVYGDVDILLEAQAPSEAGLQPVIERVRAADGAEVASVSLVDQARLDPDVRDFVRIYQRETRRGEPANRPPGTASYILVDIDKDAIQRIFTTMVFIDEVMFCDVIENGAKLIGMISGLDAGAQIQKIIDRLSRLDGVLRVREAKIIKMSE